MRVLLIDDNYKFLGGENSLLIREKNYLEKQGHECFLYSWGKESIEQTDIYVCEEPKGKIKTKLIKFIGSKRLSREFIRVLADFRPDIIHIHLVSKYPLSIYPYLHEYKVVQTLHGPSLFCATSWGCKKNGELCNLGIGIKCIKCIGIHQVIPYLWLNRKLVKFLKQINVFHCPSKFIFCTAYRLGYQNLAYVPLGIGHMFEKKDIDVSIVRKKDILFVGSMAKVKGIDYLYDAYKQVLERHPDSRLILVGAGPYCDIIKRKSQYDGIDSKVIIKGTVPPSQIADLCLSCSAFVCPSIWHEQFGMVGPEALSMKLPVVGSMVGGISEWLHHNEWGYLVPPRSSKELAKHLIYLLDNPEICKKFGEAGRKFILNYYNNQRYLDNLCGLLETTAKGEVYSKIN